VQHGEEHGPLHREREAPLAEQVANDLVAAGLPPEALEEGHGAEALPADAVELAVV